VFSAFPKDVDDAARPIHESNLGFYHQKYFGKKVQATAYGKKDEKEVLAMVKDTIEITDEVVKSLLDADLDSPDTFVKFAEESRRERQRRIDAGDDTAKLKFQPAVLSQSGAPPFKPSGVNAVKTAAATKDGGEMKSGAVAAHRAKQGAK